MPSGTVNETLSELRTPVNLPLGRDDALAVGLPGRNDKQAAAYFASSGSFVLVYQSGVGLELSDLALFEVRSDGSTVSEPRRLALVDKPLTASPSIVSKGSQSWLYFVAGDSLDAVPQVWKAEVSVGGVHAAQQLPAIPFLRKASGWPQWTNASGRTYVSFRGPGSRPYFGAYSSDGVSQPEKLIDVAAAYVRVTAATGGGWILNFQRKPSGTNTLTYAAFSEDGITWGAPVSIANPEPPNWPDVHDAFALPRIDRGVDVYYCYPTPKKRVRGAFNLYRRAIIDNVVGPEQLLTEVEEFDPYSPTAHRMPDGTVLVTFSNIESDNQGVTSAQLHLAKLLEDAPLESPSP
jgi:hypothetical protein